VGYLLRHAVYLGMGAGKGVRMDWISWFMIGFILVTMVVLWMEKL
jgi:hypothetical protein